MAAWTRLAGEARAWAVEAEVERARQRVRGQLHTIEYDLGDELCCHNTDTLRAETPTAGLPHPRKTPKFSMKIELEDQISPAQRGR